MFHNININDVINRINTAFDEDGDFKKKGGGFSNYNDLTNYILQAYTLSSDTNKSELITRLKAHPGFQNSGTQEILNSITKVSAEISSEMQKNKSDYDTALKRVNSPSSTNKEKENFTPPSPKK